jgi:hypothetical protein
VHESLHAARIDKSAFSVVALGDDSADRAYWHTKTPQERFEAMELMRAINYGYDPATARLQRLLEVVELGAS